VVKLKAEVLDRNHDKLFLLRLTVFGSPAILLMIMGLLYFLVPEYYEDQQLVILNFGVIGVLIIVSIFSSLFLFPRYKFRFEINFDGVTLFSGNKLIKKYVWTEIKKIEIIGFPDFGRVFKNIEISNGLENPRYKQLISNTKNSIISMPLTEKGLSVVEYYAQEYGLIIQE